MKDQEGVEGTAKERSRNDKKRITMKSGLEKTKEGQEGPRMDRMDRRGGGRTEGEQVGRRRSCRLNQEGQEGTEEKQREPRRSKMD